MISRKDLATYNNIIVSFINGQFKDVKDFIKKLSKEDKKEFFEYLHENQDDEYIRYRLTKFLLDNI